MKGRFCNQPKVRGLVSAKSGSVSRRPDSRARVEPLHHTASQQERGHGRESEHLVLKMEGNQKQVVSEKKQKERVSQRMEWSSM